MTTRRPVLGLVTIGQAPRDDLTPDVVPLLAGIDLVQHGALDPLGDRPTPDDLAALAPEPDEAPLTSRLRGGGAVVLGHRALLPLLADAVDRSEQDGATATLLLCTGHFAGLRASRPLLEAESLVQQGVRALAGDRPVGVVCPLPDQADDVRARWQHVLPGAVSTSVASPYTDGADVLAHAATQLASAGAHLLVLDCVGYTERMRAVAAEAAGRPVLLARALAVRLAAEFAVAGAGVRRVGV
ncbi:AroM family protein [Goodfellowiella coeruleoviolacea]|uniref:Protein AroM n=1 Tax=Goodfellowiella coeruleoviolacea TaxID=334858 RepID=A0AAE3G8E3_9PSEU|nr:AroM family protein [Goodfellowiella coeruleoviolacea]MCP2163616.1 protein AroM [Goodfellowiella coeruleoviolacea]